MVFLGLRSPSTVEDACPPRKWVLEEFSKGHWILDHTDAAWGWYMDFLNVSKESWPDEFNCSDIHQYSFKEDGTYVMNHTIPKTGFHLIFKAHATDEWEKNPYPSVTPAGFDKHAAVNLSDWRNAIDAGPLGKSCSALRTDMPVAKKDPKTGKTMEHIVTFWRELTSPSFMQASLHVTDMDGKLIEPWKSKGLSYRYVRKTVQSFPDAALRLPCVATGIEDGTQFC
eukprot:UN1237